VEALKMPTHLRPSNDEGFTLIEVSIAMMITTVGVLALAGVIAVGARQLTGSQDQLIAGQRAAEAADRRAADHPVLQELVVACRAAAGPAAVVGVLREAVARRKDILAAIGPCGEQATRTLFRSPTLTVQWISWAPGMRAPAHDHRMWAVIGVLCGREDNGKFVRAGDRLERVGVTSIGEGEVVELPADVIHDVANPFDGFTIALHVYGGDINGAARSAWHPVTGMEQPFDGAMVDAFTAEFNARQRAEPVPFTAASVPRIVATIMSRAAS